MSTKHAAEQLVNALTQREMTLNESEIRNLLAKLHTCDRRGNCVACRAFAYLDTLILPASKRSA